MHVETDDPTQGFGIFARAGVADSDTNAIRVLYNFGFGGKGIFPGRDNDRFGIGYYYAATSGDLPDFLGLDHEHGFELFYNFEITPWFHVTPDIQIIDPAQEDAETTTVLGLRANMKF